MKIKNLKKQLKKIKVLKKDQNGLLYSSELLIGIILLIFIIAIMANISDDLNEKILSVEEMNSLEKTSVQASDFLINNPGSPENWEDDEGLDNGIVSSNIIPGLSIKKKDKENGQFLDESKASEKIISNTISYEKIKKVKSNYNKLINENLFNNSYISSISFIPLNKNMNSMIMGDDMDIENNVIVVNRSVKCDFYTNFVIYKFNELDLYGEDYNKSSLCSHDTNPNLENHTNDGNSIWLCHNFRVYRNSLNEYNYYLISSESTIRANNHWILESDNHTSNQKERLNDELIDLNPYFTADLENITNNIYSIHFNVEKSHAEDFNSLLVAVPKNMTEEMISNNELKYDYFRSQQVEFILKTAYK
ncbi:hypothetical protein [uncultured Methanobrevibacter sp.]|uniref:hypothetical protein n=1 Tax=uncultured Methanobrevibacter sp. TaxID=253161 RepID=UPI0026358CD4